MRGWGGGRIQWQRHAVEKIRLHHHQYCLYFLHDHLMLQCSTFLITWFYISSTRPSSIGPCFLDCPYAGAVKGIWKCTFKNLLSYKLDKWLRYPGKYLNIYEKKEKEMLSLPPPPSFRPMKWGSLLYLTWWRMAGIHILKIAASCCYCHYYMMGNHGAALIWLH